VRKNNRKLYTNLCLCYCNIPICLAWYLYYISLARAKYTTLETINYIDEREYGNGIYIIATGIEHAKGYWHPWTPKNIPKTVQIKIFIIYYFQLLLTLSYYNIFIYFILYYFTIVVYALIISIWPIRLIFLAEKWIPNCVQSNYLLPILYAWYIRRYLL